MNLLTLERSVRRKAAAIVSLVPDPGYPAVRQALETLERHCLAAASSAQERVVIQRATRDYLLCAAMWSSQPFVDVCPLFEDMGTIGYFDLTQEVQRTIGFAWYCSHKGMREQGLDKLRELQSEVTLALQAGLGNDRGLRSQLRNISEALEQLEE